MSYECPDCGKELPTERGRDSHRSQVHDWSRMVAVSCSYCGEKFEKKRSHVDGEHAYEKTFCSNDCKGAWYSENNCGEDNPLWEGGRSEFQCETCGETFEAWDKDNPKYCSRGCQEFPTGEDHPRWNPDYEWWPHYGSEWSDRRKEIIERDGECHICSIPNVAYRSLIGRNLDVHHVVPFEEFDDHEEANDLSNLVPLCASCHNIVERAV